LATSASTLSTSWPGIAVEDGVASLAYCPGYPRL
jgi:hypothetical protein